MYDIVGFYVEENTAYVDVVEVVKGITAEEVTIALRSHFDAPKLNVKMEIVR